MHVYSSFICKSPKIKTIQMSFNGGTVKQIMVTPYQGILLRNKKEETTDTHNSLHERQGNDTESSQS